MVNLPDNNELELPTCYFCEKTSGMFGENRLHMKIVQAASETPDEAKKRRVCKQCDPKR